MKRKHGLIIAGIASIVALVVVVALIWWAEGSWKRTQAAMEASTSSEASLSSSIENSSKSSDTASSTSTDASLSSSSDETSQTQDSTASSSQSSASDSDDAVATDPTTTSQSTKNGKTVAQVQLTWWDAESAGIQANGAVNNVVETGGTCTLTATKGSVSRSVSREATVNATNTSCGEITIPRSQLAVGNWTIRLSYSSSKSQGVSGSQTVNVAD